jgi:hypothetical protein
MKRSKLFLAVTTGVLAIVGVAAAKSRFQQTQAAYTSGGSCVSVGSINATNNSNNGGSKLHTSTNTNAKTLYSLATTCHTPLFSDSE